MILYFRRLKNSLEWCGAKINVYDEALFYHTEADRLQGLIALHAVRRGVQSPCTKTQSHLKRKFPPKMKLLQSQQNFLSYLKSNLLFILIWNICFKKFSKWLRSSLANNITFPDFISLSNSTDIFRITGKQYYTLFQSLYQTIESSF